MVSNVAVNDLSIVIQSNLGEEGEKTIHTDVGAMMVTVLSTGLMLRHEHPDEIAAGTKVASQAGTLTFRGLKRRIFNVAFCWCRCYRGRDGCSDGCSDGPISSIQFVR